MDRTSAVQLFPYALWRDLVSDHSPGSFDQDPSTHRFHTPYGVTSFRTGGHVWWYEVYPGSCRFHTPYGVTSFRTYPG